MADEATGTEGEGKPNEGEQAPDPKNEAGASSKTFTQEQVDDIVKNRLARERERTADYDELKAKAAKHDEAEAARMSETERLQKERDDAVAASAEATTKANERLVQAAILAEAAKQGANPELLAGVLDKSKLTVGDDGQVTGLDEAVKAAVERFPQIVGQGTSGSADQGARGGGPSDITREQLAGMQPEEVAQALSDGKLKHLL